MKIVINCCYGGFGISKPCARKLGLKEDYNNDDIRTDERLIAMVERNSASASAAYAHLMVVEIPDTATDWEIEEYDGLECVIAVVNGKIYRV